MTHCRQPAVQQLVVGVWEGLLDPREELVDVRIPSAQGTVAKGDTGPYSHHFDGLACTGTDWDLGTALKSCHESKPMTM